jgi:uncharacterized membrane protein YdjX (TVP38/TMEM64 family)
VSAPQPKTGGAVPAPQGPASPWIRLALILVALAAAIILPFLLWGEDIERLAPDLLSGADTRLLIAGIGVALLVTDLVLPIPSSIVSVTLCLLLGPLLGALAVALGMLGGFLCGYLLGRLLPRAALRRWVGAELWDAVSRRAADSGALWIMASRPVPVLAEATAVIAGSLGVPFPTALAAALASSLGVAACYGVAAAAGLSVGGFWLAFAASMLLSALLWFLSRIWRGGMNV